MAGQRGTIFLLLGMLAWIVAGFAGAVIAAGLLGAGSILIRNILGLATPSPDRIVYVLIAASGFQVTLLLGALWQGRRAGLSDGIGARSIRHVGAIILLSAAMIAWLMTFLLLAAAFPALREFARSVTPDVLSGLGEGGPVAEVLGVALMVVLAPVSEEVFFRGWLWEALRQRGHTIGAIVALTVTPWLLLHGIDSPGRIVFLIPAAVAFSLARYLGGGVLASMTVHVTNNVTAVLIQTISVLSGHG